MAVGVLYCENIRLCAESTWPWAHTLPQFTAWGGKPTWANTEATLLEPKAAMNIPVQQTHSNTAHILAFTAWLSGYTGQSKLIDRGKEIVSCEYASLIWKDCIFEQFQDQWLEIDKNCPRYQFQNVFNAFCEIESVRTYSSYESRITSPQPQLKRNISRVSTSNWGKCRIVQPFSLQRLKQSIICF